MALNPKQTKLTSIHVTSSSFFQVVSYDPRHLANLVGDSNTYIPDDIIVVAVNIMRAYTSQQDTPYICFYSPVEIEHFCQTSTKPNQPIPDDRSSINIHHLPGHWVTSYYNHETGVIHVYDSLISKTHKEQVIQQLMLLYSENQMSVEQISDQKRNIK